MSIVLPHRPRRQVHLAAGLLAGLSSITAGLAGCSTSPDSGTVAPAAAPDARASVPEANAAFVARTYLITPKKARTLGYRIDWQDRSEGNATIDTVEAFGSAVFARDSNLRITRYDGTSGTRLWRVPMLTEISQVEGMTYLPIEDALHVGVGSEMHVYDGGTGILTDRQSLARFINTPAVPAGRFLIYGSRDGLVVWHAYQVNAAWRAYRIAPTIDVAPAFSAGYVVAAGRGGTVTCLRLRDASRVWEERTLDEIVAAPVAGGGYAYVSSLDQHLRAWPLSQDRPIPAWEYLTAAPLTDSPTLLGDALYQRVPGHGLHRFQARPLDRPGGVLEWASSPITGTVAARRQDTLLVWDADRRLMQVVDQRTGDLIDEVELPSVTSVHVTDLENGDIYLGGTGGRVLRMVPSSS